MKANRITFGAWSPGDGGFRDELYVYCLMGVDSLIAERSLCGNGEERILVHDGLGHATLLVTYSLRNFRFSPQCVWDCAGGEGYGDGYSFIKSSIDDFLKSLEDSEVCESCEGYSLRRISEEDVEID